MACGQTQRSAVPAAPEHVEGLTRGVGVRLQPLAGSYSHEGRQQIGRCGWVVSACAPVQCWKGGADLELL